ncbi:MAG TPA: hypothetical protein DCS80_05615 [Betaproteobacteria bacterium]|nr:hypothetical protein [Betaproteobacteria bacterium]
MARTRRTFSPEFKLESAQLVVEQGYTVKAASEAVSVARFTIKLARHLCKSKSIQKRGKKYFAE